MSRVLVLVALLCACKVHRTYECNTDADCVGAGTARCESTRYCSFADSVCSSGFRYDDYAGSGLDGECVMGGGAGTPAPGCPAGYIIVGSLPGGYRFSSVGQAWPDAEADCENDGAGTHLAVIDGANENDGLESQLGVTRTWFGLTDRITEGTYRTVTNVVQTYLPWESGEPMSEDDCITVKEAEFADEDCTDKRPLVCECDGLAPVAGSY